MFTFVEGKKKMQDVVPAEAVRKDEKHTPIFNSCTCVGQRKDHRQSRTYGVAGEERL